MKVFRTRKEFIQWRKSQKGSLAFVPTMGALHEGHLSLIRRAKSECRNVVVSIFVNPTQFGPHEDFQSYPRNLKSDLRQLAPLKVAAVFAPQSVAEVYRGEDETSIRAKPTLTDRLCGLFRPGHFDGVCTVVFKLFRIVEPTKAYFGLKDFQQYEVIRAMVEDLFLPVKIVGCPIHREPSGLAMSSRNAYLKTKDRAQAAEIYRSLQSALTVASARRSLSRMGFRVQYVEEWQGRRLAAVIFRGVRLIDNVALTEIKKRRAKAKRQFRSRILGSSKRQAVPVRDSIRPRRA